LKIRLTQCLIPLTTSPCSDCAGATRWALACTSLDHGAHGAVWRVDQHDRGVVLVGLIADIAVLLLHGVVVVPVVYCLDNLRFLQAQNE